MEPIVSSETLAVRTQTPGSYPKRKKLNLEHSKNLKTRMSWNILHKYIQMSQSCNLKCNLAVVARKVHKQWCGGACTLSSSGLLSLWICVVVSSFPTQQHHHFYAASCIGFLHIVS